MFDDCCHMPSISLAVGAAKEDKLQHDTRKLKKADRLKLVLRNKDEATELFKGGNFGHATERYIRALGHCRQFFDLAAEDEDEVNGIQVRVLR
jgi:hypothetical protein